MRRYLIAAALQMLSAPALADTYAPGACSLVPGSQTCIDATPCKTLTDGNVVCLAGATLPAGALSIPQACWKYSYEFACDVPTPTNSCTPYENNAACAVVNSVCTDHKPETGACTSWNYTYKCMTSAAQTSTTLECSGALFDTSLMTAPANQNNTFAKAALAMEVARETQVYAQPGHTIFNGVPESCTKGYFGLRNCCSGTPGAVSNRGFMSKIAGEAAFSVAKYAGEKLIDTASPYVFDAMYQNVQYFSSGLIAAVENASHVVQLDAAEGFTTAIGTNFAANGFTLSAYGFTYGTGTFEGANLASSTMDLSGTFGLQAGEGFVAFDPYSFALSLALQYMMKLAQCSQDEQVFQMHKGANLTVFLSEECSKTALLQCVEHRERYCSFNSVLAKIINIQGKTQMGLNISDCTGLTPEQVSSLDFTRIDFSEFTGQLMEQARNGLPNNVKGNYAPIMQNTSSGSAQNPGNGLAYPTGAAPAAAPPTQP
ncbi:conjugal transfer protein TraN [Massilia sp. CT11-137]|uniref:conjugal transfer protein TraN n=1 Tax=Massilia sp. CT11-137 TaxID=3393901 RepID=UPI0039A50C53